MLFTRPRIDYAMLGQAVSEYKARGYRYVECPWVVNHDDVAQTCPDMERTFRLAYGQDEDRVHAWPVGADYLVGSAEQSFLSLELDPGYYVGVTPCFRWEYETSLLYQHMFMKVELFVNGENSDLGHVIADAYEVMSMLGNTRDIKQTSTEEGYDLSLYGIEIGSYGERATEKQAWIYGTGLALPRFSVALAFKDIA